MTAVDPKRRPFLAARIAAAVSVAWFAAAVAAAFAGLSWQWPACGLVLALVFGAFAHLVAETVRRGRRAARSFRRVDRATLDRAASASRNVRVLPPEGRLLAAMAATPQVGPVVRWPTRRYKDGLSWCRECGQGVDRGWPHASWCSIGQEERDDWSRKAPPLAAVPDEGGAA